MKIAVYNYREFDEGQYFEKFSQHYCVEIIKIYDSPNKENAVLAKGCNGVSVITTAITKEIIFNQIMHLMSNSMSNKNYWL